MTHLLVHLLDDLRHEGASTLSWEAVKTNLGAWPYQAALGFAVAYAIWPKLRTRADAWVKAHLHAHRQAIAADHRQALADHGLTPKDPA